MNFTNAVTIIKESYKNPKILHNAMNFLDAITLLQNTWRQKKNQFNFYYLCEDIKKSRFYDKLSQQETIDEHIFDNVVRIGYGNLLLTFLTIHDAKKLSLVDRQCALAVYWQRSNENLRCSHCRKHYLDDDYYTISDMKGHIEDGNPYVCIGCPCISWDCKPYCGVKDCKHKW